MKPCKLCVLGKFVTRPHKWKLSYKFLVILQRVQGNISGHIDPLCEAFRYIFALNDASTKWSHISLLTSRNMDFPRLLA